MPRRKRSALENRQRSIDTTSRIESDAKNRAYRCRKTREKGTQSEVYDDFTNGKQKRVLRPKMIEGLPIDEFIANNADPIWLHQNEMWEYM